MHSAPTEIRNWRIVPQHTSYTKHISGNRCFQRTHNKCTACGLEWKSNTSTYTEIRTLSRKIQPKCLGYRITQVPQWNGSTGTRLQDAFSTYGDTETGELGHSTHRTQNTYRATNAFNGHTVNAPLVGLNENRTHQHTRRYEHWADKFNQSAWVTGSHKSLNGTAQPALGYRMHSAPTEIGTPESREPSKRHGGDSA